MTMNSSLHAQAMMLGLSLVVLGCNKARVVEVVPAPVVEQTQKETKPARAIQFEDVATASGVSWTAHNGEEGGMYGMIEFVGSGCAIDDFDGDNRADLILAGGGQIGLDHDIRSLPIALYRQIAPWKFSLVTEASNLQPIRHYNHGIWTADHDEDGFSDLLITGWSGLQLFRNQGDGTFADVTDRAGLSDPMWSQAAAWADLNQDQILDLFVGHYVDWSPQNNPVCTDTSFGHRILCYPNAFHGQPCLVYLGNGDGTFRDGSEELGIHEIGKTLGVVIADINDDGRPDVYVANDTLANQLYEAQPTGKYREVGIRSGVALGETATADGSMGVEIGDLNADGKLDYWVSNFENQTFALYTNLGSGVFNHSSRAFGVTAVGSEAVGFGTILFDADGDGYLDIFCANGHIWAPNPHFERRQLPYLFWNDHAKRLVNIAVSAGDYFRQRHLGRGSAVGDLDSNGTPDLLVTHTNEPVAILRNDTEIANWISVRLIGRSSPRSAICARVTIRAGDRFQTAVVKGGGSYLSTSDRNLLFGLGASTVVESLEVHWPSGKTTKLDHVEAHQQLVLIEGDE